MTKDPILSTPKETVVWDLEDGSPMPPEGARYVVLAETYDMGAGEVPIRTIKRIRLAD